VIEFYSATNNMDESFKYLQKLKMMFSEPGLSAEQPSTQGATTAEETKE
jgi:hypothetical protein